MNTCAGVFRLCPLENYIHKGCRLSKCLKHHQAMSERCKKTFFYLVYVFFTVGSIAYSFYLIWLLAYLKDNGNYWFFAFIPAGIFLNLIMAAVLKDREDFLSAFSGVIFPENYATILRKGYVFLFPLSGVHSMVMCSFTMLTRQAYYHLSDDVLIGPDWVIMSLKGSIVFFVCGFFIEKEFRLQSILESKDILNRGLLDFMDIFNLVQLLSSNQCVGIGSSMAEGSSLEKAIQAFCTMSLLIMLHMYDIQSKNRLQVPINGIYLMSVLLQNIPFLIIRIIVWAKYNVFSLGFMVKNILAIIVCCAEIQRYFRSVANVEQNDEPNNDDYQPF